jgi:phenylalanyl-tRNA synthetase beta chain
MKISWNWLREELKIDVDEVEQVAERLTETGSEVEAVERPVPLLKGVVTARVKRIEPHPSNANLLVARLDTGMGEATCVTAAKNLKDDDVVPYAALGATIADGTVMGHREFDGVLSEGMMLSAEEIGLPDIADEFGILRLPKDEKLGRDVREVLGLDDYVLDISITPNRGDLLSVRGLAKEVSAILDIPMKELDASISQESLGNEILKEFRGITLKDDGCSVYALGFADNVRIAPSPIRERVKLSLLGMRPINNVVDATNLVMLYLGQPLHAFDYDLLPDKEITVRCAYDGEKIVTLDGKERHLTSEDLLITSGGIPVALAGVMGGENTEINENTKRIALESANFDSIRVSKTYRRLGLPSEAAYRFARKVDPAKVSIALHKTFEYLSKWGAARPLGEILERLGDEKPRYVELTKKKLKKVLLLEDMDLASDILGRLGFVETSRDEDKRIFQVPSFRPDISIEEDLIEEVGRIWGYDKMESRLPAVTRKPGDITERMRTERQLRNVAMGRGYVEVITYSFVSPDMLRTLRIPDNSVLASYVALSNPLSRDQSIMRTSLAFGLVKAAVANIRNGWRKPIRMFEIGKVFHLEEGTELGVREHLRLGGIVCPGKDPRSVWEKQEDDFFSVKADIVALAEARGVSLEFVKGEYPFGHRGQTAHILCGDQTIGYLCRLKPKIAEELSLPEPVLLFEVDLEVLERSKARSFGKADKYPAVYRDISILIDKDTPVQKVKEDIKGLASQYVRSIRLFDVYEGKGVPEGKVSVAFTLEYRSEEVTLRDEEVDRAHMDLRKALQEKGYVLR